MKHFGVRIASFALALALLSAQHSQAQVTLLATGTLDQSRAGSFADLSGLNVQSSKMVRLRTCSAV